MANWFTGYRKIRFHVGSQTIAHTASLVLVTLSILASPTFAKDPFRTSNPKPIGDRTEAAFRALFEQGNYVAGTKFIQQAEPNEPLAYAMKASLAYMALDAEKDTQKKSIYLEQFRANAVRTRESAQSLVTTDPLRGNLYLAVGSFLEGGHIFLTEGSVKGTPKVLGSVQQAFKYLDIAAANSPNDPELNLIKGYMDLFLSLNLPFSSPSQAIDRLERFANPRYLADRGIALGYRDLKQSAKAMVAVDRALQATPNNPELHYLKAQILVQQGNNKDSIPLFEKALSKKEQLPPGLVTQITRELNGSRQRLASTGK